MCLHVLIHKHSGGHKLATEGAWSFRLVVLFDVLLKSVLDGVDLVAGRTWEVALSMNCYPMLFKFHSRRENFSTITSNLLDEPCVKNLFVILQGCFR